MARSSRRRASFRRPRGFHCSWMAGFVGRIVEAAGRPSSAFLSSPLLQPHGRPEMALPGRGGHWRVASPHGWSRTGTVWSWVGVGAAGARMEVGGGDVSSSLLPNPLLFLRPQRRLPTQRRQGAHERWRRLDAARKGRVWLATGAERSTSPSSSDPQADLLLQPRGLQQGIWPLWKARRRVGCMLHRSCWIGSTRRCRGRWQGSCTSSPGQVRVKPAGICTYRMFPDLRLLEVDASQW